MRQAGRRRPTRVLALLLLWISTAAAAAAAASTLPLETLGIPPQDEAYYRGGVIKCRDGSGKFTRDQLNDDFCDCPDGTDEPGEQLIESCFLSPVLGHLRAQIPTLVGGVARCLRIRNKELGFGYYLLPQPLNPHQN